MKKFYLFLILILIYNFNIIASNSVLVDIKVISSNKCGTSPGWSFTGNNVGPGDFLGSTNCATVNFIVNSTAASPTFTTYNIMQLHANGNVGIGACNIITPLRQLDIFQNNNDPQLRLTYFQNSQFTDMLTNSSGDLILTPTNMGLGTTTRNVGINTQPTEMLDVNGNGRFRNIPNASGINYSFVLAQNSAGSAPGTLAGIDFSTLAQNGLKVNTSSLNIELGSNTINDATSSLLHPTTYVLMYNSGANNNLWWQDNISGGASLPSAYSGDSRFRIGNKHYLYDPLFPQFTDAKFTVSNGSSTTSNISNDAYNTAAIISNSFNCHRTLSVEHSNWTWNYSSGSYFPTNPNSNPIQNVYSHISEGAECGDIAVYGLVDSIIGHYNVGVHGEVIHTGNFNIGQVGTSPTYSIRNFGGVFNVSIDGLVNDANYGVHATVYTDRSFNKFPYDNTGIFCHSENADTVHGVLIEAYNGNKVNTGLHVQSYVDPLNNPHRAPDVYGGIFLTHDGLNSNTGIKNDVSNNIHGSLTNYGMATDVSNNSTNSNPVGFQINYGFNTTVDNNSNCNFNYGHYLELNNDENDDTNIGYLSSLIHNYGTAINTGIEVGVDANNITSGSGQTNYGMKIEVNNNYSVWKNTGIDVLIEDNDPTTYAINSEYNTAFHAIVDKNYEAIYNAGVIAKVGGNQDVSSPNNQQLNFGVQGIVNGNDNARENIGVIGDAQNNNITVTGVNLLNVGVQGLASGSTAQGVPNNGNIGVWGWDPTANFPSVIQNNVPTTLQDVAGYFDGDIAVTGDIYYGSDIKLTDSINNIGNDILSKLTNLTPISYYFKTDEFKGMSLSRKLHFGLTAQDVFKNFPNLVVTLNNPAIIDTNGQEKYPAVSYQAVNYLGFIPLLIHSDKVIKGNIDSLKTQNEALKQVNNKQNTQIDSLKNVLNNMQSQMNTFASILNDCCKNNKSMGMNDENKTKINTTIKIISDNSVNNNKTELYQNKPNPFKTITTFSYLLGTAGFVELEITNQYGQLIEKLVSTNQETGNYSIDWDSYKVSPGLYYYSLKVNGLMLVKKAIKIN